MARSCRICGDKDEGTQPAFPPAVVEHRSSSGPALMDVRSIGDHSRRHGEPGNTRTRDGVICGLHISVYVAPTGPVFAYCDSRHHLDPMDNLGRSVKLLYVPLAILCEACPPIGDAFEAYGRWCEGVE